MPRKSKIAAHKTNDSSKLEEKSGAKTRGESGCSVRIGRIYSRSITIVSAELAHLRKRSLQGKLVEEDAYDLAMYVKLLGDIIRNQRVIKQASKEDEADALSKLTDEQLETKVLEIIREKKK